MVRHAGIIVHTASVVCAAGVKRRSNFVRIAKSGRRPHIAQNAGCRLVQALEIFAELKTFAAARLERSPRAIIAVFRVVDVVIAARAIDAVEQIDCFAEDI